MGYTTQFSGQFFLDKQVSMEQYKYLVAFTETRRVSRDPKKLKKKDPIREAVGLPVGNDACYCVNEDKESIINYNVPPDGQPGFWCGWTISDSLVVIEWDGSEKFYYYIEWLTYLINHFIKPWGYVLNGEVKYRGEDFNDVGIIVVKDNVVSVNKWF